MQEPAHDAQGTARAQAWLNLTATMEIIEKNTYFKGNSSQCTKQGTGQRQK